MQNSYGKRRSRRIWLLRSIVAGVITLAIFTYLRITSTEVSFDTPTSSAPRSIRFGPGVWIEPDAATATIDEPGNADTTAPGGLVITADGHLIVNKALHDVIDYFLLGGHPGERASHIAKLSAHLKASLPVIAYQDAIRIVQNYVAYLDAHDQLLARESVPATPEGIATPMDLDRIAAWVAQRARLRQTLLGVKVAQAWFDEDEAETQQTLATMRKRSPGSIPALTTDTDPLQSGTGTLLAMRAKGASQDAQRQHIATQFGEAAAQRFDAQEREEQAWQTRYVNYRQAADQIVRQPGIDPADRNRQLEVLLKQTFSSEPEQIRARALGAQ
jgi:lipase chaperone LimK